MIEIQVQVPQTKKFWTTLNIYPHQLCHPVKLPLKEFAQIRQNPCHCLPLQNKFQNARHQICGVKVRLVAKLLQPLPKQTKFREKRLSKVGRDPTIFEMENSSLHRQFGLQNLKHQKF